MKRKSPTLDQAIDAFLLTKRVEARSPRTLGNYEYVLRTFRAYAGDQSVDALSVDQARGYLVWLGNRTRWQDTKSFAQPDGKPLSPSTLQTHARNLKVFSAWLVKEELTKTDPFARLALPKVPKLQLPTLAETQTQEVLADLRSSPRNYALFATFLDTGLRLSELTGLTLDRLDLAGGWVKVVGKGRKERRVPLGSETRLAVSRYLTRERPESSEPFVFLSDLGEQLTSNGVRLMMRRVGKRLGIQGVRFSPHTLRHTFATYYLRNGGDVFSLQRLLGHSDLKTTQLYLDLVDDDLQRAHEAASPLDRIARVKKVKLRVSH